MLFALYPVFADNDWLRPLALCGTYRGGAAKINQLFNREKWTLRTCLRFREVNGRTCVELAGILAGCGSLIGRKSRVVHHSPRLCDFALDYLEPGRQKALAVAMGD